jgi:hypothetical protein
VLRSEALRPHGESKTEALIQIPEIYCHLENQETKKKKKKAVKQQKHRRNNVVVGAE